MKTPLRMMLFLVAMIILDLGILFADQASTNQVQINQKSATQITAKQTAIVSIPVADIRQQNPETKEIAAFVLPEKSEDKSIFFADNKFQETQVLFGDTLNIIKEEGDWAFVEIPKQKCFNKSNEPILCNGWISKNAIINKALSQDTNLVVKSLWAPVSFKTDQVEEKFNISLGTRLFGKKTSDGFWEIRLARSDGKISDGKISDEHVQKITDQKESIKDLRADLVERAKLFLASPYIWGGASAPAKFYPDSMPQNMLGQAAGVDCSGLVYTLLKSFGLIGPRNSNDQYLFSEKIESGENLKPGDLVFFAKVGPDGKTPQRVTHIAIYAGKDVQENTLIIESQGVAQPFGVRLIPSIKYTRLGNKQLDQIKTGDVFEWTDERNKTTNLSYICFGTFLTPQKLTDMRLDFLH